MAITQIVNLRVLIRDDQKWEIQDGNYNIIASGTFAEEGSRTVITESEIPEDLVFSLINYTLGDY